MRNKLRAKILHINLGSGNPLCSFLMCTGEYTHLYCTSIMFVGSKYLVVLFGFIIFVRSKRSIILLECDSVRGVQISSYILGVW